MASPHLSASDDGNSQHATPLSPLTAPTSLESDSEGDIKSTALPHIPSGDIPNVVAKVDLGTPDNWVKRDERMVRLTGKHPYNAEARIQDLFAAGFLTPTSLFYVRNHGAVPRVQESDAQAWTVRVHGLVAKETTFSITDLKKQFKVVTLPVTLVCAGNRRKEQNVHQKGLGFNWGAAGVSTALFTGVYLADVLAYVEPRRPHAKHVIFEGADTDLPNGPYGTSQRLSAAVNVDKGIILAWGMNGEALEPDHGYPLRVVIPGQIGGRSVKWLTRIEISERESQHHLHFFDNKVLPTQLSPQQARDEKHWWLDSKYIINDLNVNSAIAEPRHDEVIAYRLGSHYNLKGYAYTGGGRRITRVELSLDQGDTWSLADIAYPEDLYRSVVMNDATYGTLDLTERDTCFCWSFWSFRVPMKHLTECGSIMVRAMDDSLALQMRDMYWNPTGMMNNWWFRVAIHHEVIDGHPHLRFEHPTLAGVAKGGWMERMKAAGQDYLHPHFGLDTITHTAATPAPSVSMTRPDVLDNILVARYRAETSGPNKKPLFVVNGQVYDGTGFLEEHPGGADSIWLASGELDASEDFLAIHSDDAKVKLAQFHIGQLGSTEGITIETCDSTSSAFLNRRRWNAARLVAIIPVSHDSFIYRFALPSPEMELGLPVGQHVFARLHRKGSRECVQRAYTPVSQQDERGHIDLLIKLYLPNSDYPLGGKMTVGFHELVIGDVVDFKGPLGSFTWEGNGVVRWKDVARKPIRHLGMICGGSGITPILQVLRSVIHDSTDSETRIWLLNANKTEEDILCRTELQEMHGTERVRIHYTIGRTRPGVEWAFSVGRITDDMLREHLPAPSDIAMILVCGPEGMIQGTVKPGLARLGWDLDSSLVVF